MRAKPDYVKETPEQRKKRITESGNRLLTAYKPSKKVYKRNKLIRVSQG